MNYSLAHNKSAAIYDINLRLHSTVRFRACSHGTLYLEINIISLYKILYFKAASLLYYFWYLAVHLNLKSSKAHCWCLKHHSISDKSCPDNDFSPGINEKLFILSFYPVFHFTIYCTMMFVFIYLHWAVSIYLLIMKLIGWSADVQSSLTN